MAVFLRVALLSLFTILASGLAVAEGNVFFEFNPTPSEGLFISSLAAPSQVFTAENDFLSAFDFWFDNRGLDGTVTFELRDGGNVLIASKTVAVPRISVNRDGERFHVDLNNSIPLVSGDRYRIAIVTVMSDLRIFFAERLHVLQRDEPPAPEHLNDYAMLGPDRQNFSFKFALSENRETVPPVLSNVGTALLSPTQIRLAFNANEPVDYKINYGPTSGSYTGGTAYSGIYQPCPVFLGACDLTLNVAPATTYSYELVARDFWANESRVTGSFTSGSPASNPSPPPPPGNSNPPPPPGPADTNPPIISNIRVIVVTDQNFQVVWQTNKAADSSLVVSLDALGSQVAASVSSGVFELEHSLRTGNALSPKTHYFARLISHDPSNNFASQSLEFTTTNSAAPPPGSAPPPPPPAPPSGQSGGGVGFSGTNSSGSSGSANTDNGNGQNSNSSGSLVFSLAPASATAAGTHEVVLTWQAPKEGEPDGYRVDIFNQEKKLAEQNYVAPGVHKLMVRNLSEGDYYAIIYGNRKGIFEKVSPPINFTVGSTTSVRAEAIKRQASSSGRGKFVLIFVVILTLLFVGILLKFVILKK